MITILSLLYNTISEAISYYTLSEVILSQVISVTGANVGIFAQSICVCVKNHTFLPFFSRLFFATQIDCALWVLPLHHDKSKCALGKIALLPVCHDNIIKVIIKQLNYECISN